MARPKTERTAYRIVLDPARGSIFASKYKLYLPTEKELARELQQERKEIELIKKLKG